MDGQTLYGIGAILSGTAAFGGFVAMALGGKKALELLQDKVVIIAEKDGALRLAKSHEERAVVAEQRATDWRADAESWRADARALENRVAILENDAKMVGSLVGYARDLLRWAIGAEAAARSSGIVLAPMPPIPPDLTQRISPGGM